MDLFVISEGYLILGVIRSRVVGKKRQKITVFGDGQYDISATSLEEVRVGNADSGIACELTSGIGVQELLKVVTGVRPVFVLESFSAKLEQNRIRRSSS
jgi:hypothetical protein